MSDWGPWLLDTMFVLVGVLLAVTGLRQLFDTTNDRRYTTGAFWIILGFIFAFGESTDKTVIGVLIVVLGALTLAKGVKMGRIVEGTDEEKEEGSRRLGNWLFVPALSLAAFAVADLDLVAVR